MKIKQFLYITDASQFMRGDYTHCFTLYGKDEVSIPEWQCAGAVEFDVEIDNGAVVQNAIEALEAKEEELKAECMKKLDQVARAKGELLAIGHDS